MCFALYIASASFFLGPTGREPLRLFAFLLFFPFQCSCRSWSCCIGCGDCASEEPVHLSKYYNTTGQLARSTRRGTRRSSVLTTIAASAVGLDAQYKGPANEFGQPDLQGVWNFSSDVPLERAKEFADKKFFTREELAKQNIARETTLDRISKLAAVEVTDRVWLDYKGQAENLRTSLTTTLKTAACRSWSKAFDELAVWLPLLPATFRGIVQCDLLRRNLGKGRTRRSRPG